MEYSQRTYNHEDEVKRMYDNIGDEGIDSNGHGEAKGERINLVKTINFFQKDIQIYKADYDRLMKSKEEQDGFNIKFLQSLDIIQKKMDKNVESSKSRRHISRDERRKERSVDMYHHHSLRNSTGRAHSSSIPSHVRNNKRRSGLDDLQGEMNNIKPPTFMVRKIRMRMQRLGCWA
jgi:hypothetical protein